jgi:hypothetical protein
MTTAVIRPDLFDALLKMGVLTQYSPMACNAQCPQLGIGLSVQQGLTGYVLCYSSSTAPDVQQFMSAIDRVSTGLWNETTRRATLRLL